MRFWTILALVTMTLGFLFWGTYRSLSSKTENGTAASTEIMTVDAAELEIHLQQTTRPVLVDFWASWCGPCKVLDPILESLADEFSGRAIFLRVDIDASRDLAQRLDVSAVPTVLIFVEGREVERFEGVTREGVLRKSLEQAGAIEDVAGLASLNADDA